MASSRPQQQQQQQQFAALAGGYAQGDLDSYLNFDSYSPRSLSSDGSTQARTPNIPSTSIASVRPSPPHSFAPQAQPTQQQPQNLHPSFPYDLVPQQTGPLPYQMVSSSASSSSFSSLDLGFEDSVFQQGMDLSPREPLGGSFMDLEGQDIFTPAYFFPEEQSTPDMSGAFSTVAGSSTLVPSLDRLGSNSSSSEKLPLNMPVLPGATIPAGTRVYSGIHQQTAYQQQLERQKREQERKAAQKPEDLTQARISRLLESMKADPNPPMPSNTSKHLPHIARLKKEEEDMDEDERLLASEEGKKLTSKERRQLRNKVSARAFRSRRKEYITQLEAEVDKKTTEALDLQERVRTLQSENDRLGALTRTLLSSPAFSAFLDAMAPAVPQQQQQQPPAPVVAPPTDTRTMPKDPNPMHTSDTESAWPLAYGNNNIWANNAQVFAVTSVPEAPIDIAALEGKSPLASLLPSSTKPDMDFAALPPPCDGFYSTYDKETEAVPEQLSSWNDLYRGSYDDEDDFFDEEDEYEDSDDLMELYDADCTKIEDATVTKVAPIHPQLVEKLLGKIESVLSGEKKVEEVFDVPMSNTSEDIASEERVQNLSCAPIEARFDAAERVWKRIGVTCGI